MNTRRGFRIREGKELGGVGGEGEVEVGRGEGE